MHLGKKYLQFFESLKTLPCSCHTEVHMNKASMFLKDYSQFSHLEQGILQNGENGYFLQFRNLNLFHIPLHHCWQIMI